MVLARSTWLRSPSCCPIVSTGGKNLGSPARWAGWPRSAGSYSLTAGHGTVGSSGDGPPSQPRGTSSGPGRRPRRGRGRECCGGGVLGGRARCHFLRGTRPERVSSLVLYGAWPRFFADDSYSVGWHRQNLELLMEGVLSAWGQGRLLPLLAPSIADDDRLVSWWAGYEPPVRQSWRRRRLLANRARGRRAPSVAGDHRSDLGCAPDRRRFLPSPARSSSGCRLSRS